MIIYLLGNRPPNILREKCKFDQTSMSWTYQIDTLEQLEQLLSNPSFVDYCVFYNAGRYYFNPCDWYGG